MTNEWEGLGTDPGLLTGLLTPDVLGDVFASVEVLLRKLCKYYFVSDNKK